MSETLAPDVCVIGGGAGGLTVASYCALFGVPVVLVEKHRLGGRRLQGSLASQALIAAARHADFPARAAAFGIAAGAPAVDFAAVQRHVREVVAARTPNDALARLTALGVKVLFGTARFTGPQTVEVGGTAVAARRFVVAAGARPVLPLVPGVEEASCLTPDTIFGLAECPRHLAVLGGGREGVELAQAFRRLGAEVTLFEKDRLLAGEDPELVAVVRAALIAGGIAVHEGAEVLRVEGKPGALDVHAARGGEQGSIAASHLLVAAGWRADVEGLGLEAAGIAVAERGIAVDRGLRTANRRVYAIGDAVGGARSVQTARWHGALVAQNILFRRPVRADGTAAARAVFTDPQLAEVGLGEAEARRRHRGVRVLRWPLCENDRAAALGATAGHVKLVVSARGRVLGCAIAGRDAAELIAPFALAVAGKMTAADLAGLVLPYPTLAEVGKEAAATYLLSRSINPWIGRLIRMLRMFG